MDTNDAPTTPITKTDARQGQNMGVVRKVLGASLVLVVIAFIAAFYLA